MPEVSVSSKSFEIQNLKNFFSAVLRCSTKLDRKNFIGLKASRLGPGLETTLGTDALLIIVVPPMTDAIAGGIALLEILPTSKLSFSFSLVCLSAALLLNLHESLIRHTWTLGWFLSLS